jgi:DNA-binding NarL/FixJ family response regulator
MVVVPRLLDMAAIPDRPQAVMVGPHPLVLAAVARLISGPPLHIRVELMTRTDEALDRVGDEGHELLFCDLRSPPIASTEIAERLAARRAATRVIILADQEDAGQLLASLDCGAAGFFTKDASADEFIDGVQAVAAGHYVIGRRLAKEALSRLSGHQPAGDGRYERLSPAERGILSLVGQAQTTRSIAADRGISVKTVRNHMASIYRKLEVRNRSEAMMWSLRMYRGGARDSSPDAP